MKNPYIKSPLNYVGGKYKILKDIIPAFPKEIDKFVDLFAGGLNVGINVEAKTIYANDQLEYLIDLFTLFQNRETEDIIKDINAVIDKYDLSKTNSLGYNKLRDDYNELKNTLDFFVLICYAFNHQIRFNNKNLFNSSFGRDRSSYNSNIEKNLIKFCKALKEKKVILTNKDFLEFDFKDFGTSDLVYCDPPYLITDATYNNRRGSSKGWSEREESELLELLDSLSLKGVKFALSNVFYHKGLENNLLIEWSKKYETLYIDKSYSNCNYQLKDRAAKTVEVLITNY